MARTDTSADSWAGDTEVAGLLLESRSYGMAHEFPGRRTGVALWVGVLCWAFVATALLFHDRFGSAPQPKSQADVQDLIQLQGLSFKGRHFSGPGGGAKSSLYQVYSDSFLDAKYIDLTHAFGPDSPVWPGFGHAKFGAAVGGARMEGFVELGQQFTYGEHGFQAGTYSVPTDQYGTQLDPPAHWNELGATISDLPATFAVRPLVVLDIHEQVTKNKSYHASVGDAEDWESKHGPIPQGSVVMVRSDWSKGWANFTANGLPGEYPGVDLKLLQFLHNNRSILFHGHEPLDTDMTPTLEGEGWLMHNNFAQAEGVMNLDQVPDYGCLVSIGFAKTMGGLGGFARYVAICPKGTPGGITIAEASGAPLPQQKYPLRRNAQGVMVPDASADDHPTEYCSGKASLGCTNGKFSWT